MVRVSTSGPALADRAAWRSRSWGPAIVVGVAALLVAGMLFFAALTFSATFRSSMMERSGAGSRRDVIQAVAGAPLRFISGVLDPESAPKLAIDIKFKHLHKIHERRAEALRSGILDATDDDFVPAEIEVLGQTIDARMRLAEAPVDLLEGDKWPLLVRLTGEGHVFGMRRFVLRPPQQRGFQLESLYLAQLRREDVVAPRFVFAEVSLNGKKIGVMALEEFFSREMLESMQRRDAPVLRLVPAETPPDGKSNKAGTGSLRFDPAITALRPRDVDHSTKLSRSMKLARKILRAFMVGKLDAGDVFDREKIARFIAVSELWGARDALRWQNLRFYFNPLTARLEPVGYAAGLQGPPQVEDWVILSNPFMARILEDPRIHAELIEALHRIAEEAGQEEFELMLEREQGRSLRALQREYPLRMPVDIESLRERALWLGDVDGVAGVTARELSGRSSKLLPLPEVTLEETLARHDFLEWDPEAARLRAGPGRWKVEGSLILPPGIGLDLRAGTVLQFSAREGIIARGPLRFLGREDALVVLEGPVSKKKSDLWSGVYVVESERPSHWAHVVIRNTGGFERGRWRLAGGVVFRQTRVEMERCSLRGNRSDDSLNLIRASFVLRDVDIIDSTSDAFDGDHVEGEIHGGFISGAGGDGLDLGGSRVAMEGTRLQNIRDKALAVGEGSRFSAARVEITSAGIGLASKNGAISSIEGSTLRDISNVALTAYMNRAQYGPGQLDATHVRIVGAALPALAQIGSRVTIDGVRVPEVDAAIELLYKDQDTDRLQDIQ
jgi:hypothetical protein